MWYLILYRTSEVFIDFFGVLCYNSDRAYSLSFHKKKGVLRMKTLIELLLAAVEYAASLVLAGLYVLFMAFGIMILIAEEMSNSNKEVEK